MKRESLILFVGPPDCGKTMATYSLAEYLCSLDQEAFEVTPNRFFKKYDADYQNKCKEFEDKLVLNLSKKGTDAPRVAMNKTKDVFMMIDVKQNNHLKYQILEAPGELFWDPDNQEREFGSEIANLIDPKGYERGKVVFVLLLDLYTRKWDDSNNRGDCAKYQNRLKQILDNYKPGDKIIALFNRYDCRNSKNDKSDWKVWLDTYKDLFNYLASQKKWIFFPKYNVKQLPYSAGKNFKITIDERTNQTGDQHYTSDTEVLGYAQDLWKEITKKFTWI